jgi:hypothetical protein
MMSALIALVVGCIGAMVASPFGLFVQMLVLSAGCILAAAFRWGGDDAWFTIAITGFCTLFAVLLMSPAVRPPEPPLYWNLISGAVGCAVGIWISRIFNRWQ